MSKNIKNNKKKISLKYIIKNIGLREYINALLVDNNIRNAMMIQPPDYKERTEKNKKTSHIVSDIKKYFPSLKSSITNEGIILSKKDYYNNNIYDSRKMGKILGYPCANNFKNIVNNPDKKSITYNLCVKINATISAKYNLEYSYILIANRCKDDSKNKAMENIAKKANNLIKKNDFLSQIVDKFYVQSFVTIPIKIIIDKLLENKKLDQNEESEMINYIWNIGFEELPMYEFNYDNNVHKGILLTLLTYAQNTPLEPFFPLQKYPKQDMMVSEITQKWEKELIRVLDEAK
jgi:hypothetical protein